MQVPHVDAFVCSAADCPLGVACTAVQTVDLQGKAGPMHMPHYIQLKTEKKSSRFLTNMWGALVDQDEGERRLLHEEQYRPLL